jgi:glutathione S-transferase
MITIYGNPMSTCTRKVLMTLAETNTPYEMVVIDFAKGQHKQETHLRHQPFGRIPALDDAGFEMYESRAMCRYINDKANGKLVPRDAQGRAKMEQWISIETSEFTPSTMKFVYHYAFQRPQEPATLEAATKTVEVACGVMEKQLALTPFIAGNDFTLADICFMPYLEYVMPTPAKEIFAKCPHLMSWWNRIAERPTWRKVTGKA